LNSIKKNYDSSLIIPNIPLITKKNAERRYKHVSEIVSVDLLDNLKIRYHLNTEVAFQELNNRIRT
jgi:hypothetical protein